MSIDKLLLVAVLVALIVGPRRLPDLARRLAGFARSVRDITEAARTAVERDAGIAIHPEQWRALDPRRYDPRRIVEAALADAPVPTRPLDPDTSQPIRE